MLSDCNHLGATQHMGGAMWCGWCGAVRVIGENGAEGAWLLPQRLPEPPGDLDDAGILGRARVWLAEEARSLPPSPQDIASHVATELRPLAAVLERQGRLLRRAVGIVSDHQRIEGETRAVLDEYATVGESASAAERAATRLLGSSFRRRPCGAQGPVSYDELDELGRVRRGVRSWACTRDYGHSGEHVAASSLGIELHRWPRD